MTRSGYISMAWCPLSTTPTHLLGFVYNASSLKQVIAIRHILLVPIQPVFALNVERFVQKQQILILYSLVWADRVSNSWSTTVKATTLIIGRNILTLADFDYGVEVFCFICSYRHFNYLALQYFDYERTWSKLSQKHVVCIKLILMFFCDEKKTWLYAKCRKRVATFYSIFVKHTSNNMAGLNWLMGLKPHTPLLIFVLTTVK